MHTGVLCLFVCANSLLVISGTMKRSQWHLIYHHQHHRVSKIEKLISKIKIRNVTVGKLLFSHKTHKHKHTEMNRKKNKQNNTTIIKKRTKMNKTRDTTGNRKCTSYRAQGTRATESVSQLSTAVGGRFSCCAM